MVPGCGLAHDSGRHDAVTLGPNHQHGGSDRREVDNGGLRKLRRRKEQFPEIAPDSQTKPSYISRAVSSVCVLAIQRRNCSNVGGRHGLVQDSGCNTCGRDIRKLVRVPPRTPPPGQGMPPLSRPGVCARRPTAPPARPSSDLQEAVKNPANPQMPPSRRRNPEGLATRPSSHLPAWAIRDTAASGCAPCIRALRMRRGPEPTAPHGSRRHVSRRRAWLRPRNQG